MNVVTESQLDLLADALVARGYCILDDVLPAALLTQLLYLLQQLHENELKVAGVGRQAEFQIQASIRSDKIHWIAANSAATTEFLQLMDVLRIGLNRRLFMGLCDYESHFAHYPVGAFYKKHLDAFREKRAQGQANRVLSTVLYLNEAWLPSDGGELLIYAEDGNSVIETVLPVFGRWVILLSEKFPHEVLPATRERNSIAGWFRVNDSVIR